MKREMLTLGDPRERPPDLRHRPALCWHIVPLGPHVRTCVCASGGDAMHTGCVSPHIPTCPTTFAAYCTQNTPTPATLFYSSWNGRTDTWTSLGHAADRFFYVESAGGHSGALRYMIQVGRRTVKRTERSGEEDREAKRRRRTR